MIKKQLNYLYIAIYIHLWFYNLYLCMSIEMNKNNNNAGIFLIMPALFYRALWTKATILSIGISTRDPNFELSLFS